MKILLLIRSLNPGGTERQVVELAKGFQAEGREVAVAVFYAGGAFEEELTRRGIPVLDLQKKSRWDILPFFLRLALAVRRGRYRVVYGFLGTPNVLTVALKPFFRKVTMVWGVRASDMRLEQYDLVSRLNYWIESRLSRFADRIVCNSQAGLEHAVSKGFPRGKMSVVYNGIDVQRFRPDPAARRAIRKEWRVAEWEIVVGMAARLDPMKDHRSFLQAAAMLAREGGAFRFVCVGEGASELKEALALSAAELGLDGALIWAGNRLDMAGVYSAFDVAVSSSLTEGFSNTIAEAMACGVPCVVTDVGDSAVIVAGVGVAVPPGDPAALCRGLREILPRLGEELSRTARSSIATRFSLDTLVRNTLSEMRP